MATKKSQSAPKKKATAAPKKKAAAKKKSVLETKSPAVQEETQEHSAPAALTTPEPASSSYTAEPAGATESTSEKEGGLLLKLLVLAGVIVIAFVAYSHLNEKNKKSSEATAVETTTESATAETPAPATTEPAVEEPVASAPAAVEGVLVETLATDKTHDEAVAHCKSANAKLLSQDELKKLSKTAPDSIKVAGQKIWSSTADGKKKAFWVRLDKGSTNSIEKTTKLAVICK